MGAFAIVFLSVILVTGLHLTSTVPVPELSAKLLCELLCEHCNGVSNMEGGHCNCEVPEAHFKDNSPCLERAQISAAEMKLKLTHFNNTRRARSVSDLGINSKALEDTQINYSQGYNKISDELLTPPTPNPNAFQDPTLEPKKTFVKRSINNVPVPELKKVDEYQEQSPEKELFRKQYVNNFQTASIDELYSPKSITAMPSSRIFSGSNLRSAKRSVFYPQRKKRSYKRVQFARNEDGTISQRETSNLNEDIYDVIINVQADIGIPALKAKQVDNENIKNSTLQGNDDKQTQVSPPLVSDNSTKIKSEPSNPRQNSLERLLRALETFTFGKKKSPNTTGAVVSNKSRSAVEQQILNNGESDASKPTDLIDDSNSLLLESKSGLPSLATLKLPKLLSPCKLRSSINENKIIQRSKLNELKSRLEKLLPREQPRTPFLSLLQTNELLKGQKSGVSENNPLAKLVPLSSIPKCSSPLRIPQNTALGDLLTKSTVNNLKSNDQKVGMTRHEKFQNDLFKLQQNLFGVNSEQSPAQNRDANECQFEKETPEVPLKLNPSIPIETNTPESPVDCEEEYNDDAAAPMNSIDKFRSNSQLTEKVGDEIRPDTPVILPVSKENLSRTVILTAFSGDSFVPTVLPNEPITVHAGKTGLIKETEHEGNENTPITNISQSTSELPKQGTQLGLGDINITVTTSDSKAAHNDDSDDNQYPDKVKEPFVVGNVEAVPADVLSTAPVVGLEPQAMQREEPPHTTNGNSMDAKTPSDHPHFVGHKDNNLLSKPPNYYSPVFVSPAFGNQIRMSPEETYRGEGDPASFYNDMQRIYYPALLARNDLSNTQRGSVLNRPVVMVPNSIIPFDQPSRLTANFNGAPDHPNNPLPNEPNGMIMRAFVPAESHPNNPANQPPSSVFILKPLLTPDGNIPYPELLNQIRTGHAVIKITPINTQDVDKSGM